MALSQVCNVNAGSRHIVMMSQILKMESYIPERRIPQTEIPISLFFSTPSMSAMRVGIQLATKETKKKKKKKDALLPSLLSSKLYLSPSASVPLLKVFKNETFCHCLLWLFQFETMALFLFLLQKLIFMSKDLLHRFG